MPRALLYTSPDILAAAALPVDLLSLGAAAAVFFVAGWAAVVTLGPVVRRLKRRKWAAAQKQIADLRGMSWQQFEAYALAAFERAGWEGSITGGGGPDNGVDLMLRRDKVRVVVSCKQYKARVGAPFIREAVGVAVHFKANGVYVVALGGFTKAAREYAKGKPVKLVDGEMLLHFMNRSNPT